MRICVLDTSVCSENLGDYIIMDSVREHINDMFPTSMVFSATTHERISKPTYEMVSNSDYAFVGGTNLLSSNMNRYNQWKINLKDSIFIRKTMILMGVGWWQYQNKPNAYTEYLLRSVLRDGVMHSVRDSYAEEKLKGIGLKNVINTSCPTMWGLSQEHCSMIPQHLGENVVATVTDYNKHPQHDRDFICFLARSYKKVLLWPQGSDDLSYLKGLEIEPFATILPPTLAALNVSLESKHSVDYVGTRLHAGIRALQKGRRTIILGIDNRAFEKAKDFGVTVVGRDRLEKLSELIRSSFPTRINIPSENILRWKGQFA